MAACRSAGVRRSGISTAGDLVISGCPGDNVRCPADRCCSTGSLQPSAQAASSSVQFLHPTSRALCMQRSLFILNTAS